MRLDEIGNKHIEKCFDGKQHECTCTDYVIAVNGNTYRNRGLLHGLGFKYWNEKSHEWIKNIETNEELTEITEAIKGTGIKVIELRPIYRITDEETNPIKW